MRVLALILLLLAPLAAHPSPKPNPAYLDGTLVNMKRQSFGAYCSTQSTITMADSTSGNSSGSANCSPRVQYIYTVRVGPQTMELVQFTSAVSIATYAATLGVSGLFRKSSVLYGQMPGTAMQIRKDGRTYYVKIGKRESPYKLVAVE